MTPALGLVEGAVQARASDLAAPFVSVMGMLVFLVVGVAHYRGRWKSLADVWLLSPYSFLAMTYLGAGGLVVLAAPVMDRLGPGWPETAALALRGVGLSLWCVGVVGLFWLPPFLRPRWLVERRAQGGVLVARAPRIRRRDRGTT